MARTHNAPSKSGIARRTSWPLTSDWNSSIASIVQLITLSAHSAWRVEHREILHYNIVTNRTLQRNIVDQGDKYVYETSQVFFLDPSDPAADQRQSDGQRSGSRYS